LPNPAPHASAIAISTGVVWLTSPITSPIARASGDTEKFLENPASSSKSTTAIDASPIYGLGLVAVLSSLLPLLLAQTPPETKEKLQHGK
jgi:hypothetical protein